MREIRGIKKENDVAAFERSLVEFLDFAKHHSLKYKIAMETGESVLNFTKHHSLKYKIAMETGESVLNFAKHHSLKYKIAYSNGIWRVSSQFYQASTP